MSILSGEDSDIAASVVPVGTATCSRRQDARADTYVIILNIRTQAEAVQFFAGVPPGSAVIVCNLFLSEGIPILISNGIHGQITAANAHPTALRIRLRTLPTLSATGATTTRATNKRSGSR